MTELSPEYCIFYIDRWELYSKTRLALTLTLTASSVRYEVGRVRIKTPTILHDCIVYTPNYNKYIDNHGMDLVHLILEFIPVQF